MNKKLMTMLVACALSVSSLSTTAVFAEDAVVTGDTPAVTETTTTPDTTTTPGTTTPDTTTPDTTTPEAYEPEATLVTTEWTGDSDIVIDVDAKGGSFYATGEKYVWGKDGAQPFRIDDPKVEANEEGKGKVTFTKEALKNAKILDLDFENQSEIDWTKINEIEFNLVFEKGDQIKFKTVYVKTSVKAPEVTVTPTTPATPAENKGTTTTAKKEAPKTGDTMNVALYASLVLVSALAAVVLTTKKRITE
ncbi:LPXTG cell wall anchor domain-containing protein [uncultured Catenibacterium sp.]|uniref:LPXTG cell wall anchor domain-containing protein n=1 Tax=uncultured Catenibacterium sp. TaxID=286142 RepID=UPI0025DCA315|nr:LPXTG cell wall anchor domain-containing protein [uncultured Catenibacterium sp.]